MQQVDKALEAIGQFLTLFGLELTHQGVFELGPMIGKTVADAAAALGKGHAGRQFGTDSLAGDQVALEEASEAIIQGFATEAEFGSEFRFGRARSAQFEQDGVVARLQPTLQQWQQQRLMRELPGLDEPVKR